MNKGIKKTTIFKIWTLFLGISIVFRCMPTLFYQKTIIENIIITGLTIISTILFVGSKNKNKISIFEFLFLMSPIFFISYGKIDKYVLFYSVGLMYYFVIQNDYKATKILKYPLVIFAIITAIASWIGFFFQNFYFEHILSVFPEYEALKYSFLHRGMNPGFTNHYSRNALYIAIGIMVLISEIVSGKKKKRSIILTAFLFCTMFLIAKRGILLFLLVSIVLTLLIKEKDINKKISKGIKLLFVGIIFFGLAYIFIPGVSNFVIRLVQTINSDDISTGRFYLYGEALKMFYTSPIIGNGWGSFLELMKGTTFQAVHNDYLQLLAEVGVFGTIVFLIPNLLTIKYSSKALRFLFNETNKKDNLEEKELITMSLFYQIFFIFYSITGYPHFSYEQMLLYFMLSGVGLGIYKYKIKEVRK